MLRHALLAGLTAAHAYYWVLPQRDAPYQDFRHVDNATVPELEAICDSLSECLGFNAGGFLKNNLTLLQPGTTTMYVKHSEPQPPPVDISVWPWPASLTNGTETLRLGATFALIAGTPGSADLIAALARARALIFARGEPAGGAPLRDDRAGAQSTLPSLTVTLADGGAAVLPQLGVDESYVLDIPGGGAPATLNAATLFGAYHGLQTFAQLVRGAANASSGGAAYELRAAPLHIADAPAFPWRGVMLDVARHYLPLPFIFATIEAMAAAKLNALHMHLADWQAGVFAVPAYPHLWDGAFTQDDVYSSSEQASIVEFARARGVRIIPELDTPGHAASLCVGLPWMCPTPFCTDVLAPYDTTFDVIAAIFAAWRDIYPDAFFHLGGDEVGTDCWTTTPAVAAWMAARGLSPRDTYQYFVNRTTEMARGVGKTDVRWCDVFRAFNATGMSRDTVVQAWVYNDTVAQAASMGWRTLWSVEQTYYMDHLDTTWRDTYDTDPLINVPASNHPLVLGGEVTMWGESVDGSNVHATVWPRAAAAAERLWSYNAAGGNSSAWGVEDRLQSFRCLLLRRGIGAGPVWGPTARAAPNAPTSCRYN